MADLLGYIMSEEKRPWAGERLRVRVPGRSPQATRRRRRIMDLVVGVLDDPRVATARRDALKRQLECDAPAGAAAPRVRRRGRRS